MYLEVSNPFFLFKYKTEKITNPTATKVRRLMSFGRHASAHNELTGSDDVSTVRRGYRVPLIDVVPLDLDRLRVVMKLRFSGFW